MSSSIINEDLRIIKTKKALCAAMSSLLRSLSFRKITIKEICEEALVSRATFYAHFIDKYDLLRYWMMELWPKDLHCDSTYEEMERVANSHIQRSLAILKNLVCDADDETFGIVFAFILSTINLTIEKGSHGETSPKNIVLANFYAGGMISYLLWQVNNKFPPDIPPMNRYLYEMILALREWDLKEK